MNRLKRIKILSIATLTFILLSVITVMISFAVVFEMYFEVSVISVVIFLFSLIAALLLLGALTYFVLGLLVKRIPNDKKVILINTKLDDFNDGELQNENSKVKCFNKRHLSTICTHEINNLDIENAKTIRKKANQLIKKKYKKANETNPKNKHWMYQVNLFVIEEVLNIEDAKQFVLKLNNPRLIEIKKANILYIKNSETLLIREFEINRDNFVNIFAYLKILKLISKAYNLDLHHLISAM